MHKQQIGGFYSSIIFLSVGSDVLKRQKLLQPCHEFALPKLKNPVYFYYVNLIKGQYIPNKFCLYKLDCYVFLQFSDFGKLGFMDVIHFTLFCICDEFSSGNLL